MCIQNKVVDIIIHYNTKVFYIIVLFLSDLAGEIMSLH